MSVNTNSNNYYESDPNKDYNTLEKVILAEAVSFSLESCRDSFDSLSLYYSPKERK